MSSQNPSSPGRKTLLLMVALSFVAPVMAGCLGTGDDLAGDTAPETPEVPAYAPVDPALLSEPVHDILEAVDARVAATTDGIKLFAEYYLPDAEGPFPTILHSTPYKHLDKGISAANHARQTAEEPGTGLTGNRLVDFYVPRGYAVVLADVRGFGDSEGCVEVWGANEQQDQYDLVEWVAEQDWSDGKVGMIGASYPGTTPIEAAVMQPPHLTTIVAAAGLTDPYYDWHYGGVPTGESGPVGSPAAYQAIGAAAPIEPVDDPQSWMTTASNTGCGTKELMEDGWQMDSVYTEFYKERDLASRAKDINASVLYTQGFTDGNVKPTQMLRFFNDIEAPKKGFFGQWGHQFPVRDDYKDYELAWFDHWLKGVDNGVMDGPTAEVLTNRDTWRGDHDFPTQQAEITSLHLDARDMSLGFDAPSEDGEAGFVADRRPRAVDGPLAPLAPAEDAVRGTSADEERLVFTSEALEEHLYLSGVMHLDFRATMDDENAYLMAALYEVAEDGDDRDTDPDRTRIAFGGLAAALRDGVEEYKPVPAGDVVDYRMRFQPREYIVEDGSSLELVVYTVDIERATTDEAWGPTTVTFHTGPEVGSFMELPTLEGRPDRGYPWE